MNLLLDTQALLWFVLDDSCAMLANVDAFLTTDDKLPKQAQRYSEEIHIPVANPLSWLQEVII